METVMQSKTSVIYTESISEKIKAASAPILSLPSSEAPKLTTQISAPSYLNSLKENKAPPFKKPLHEARPKLLIGTLVTENDCIEIIAQSTADDLKNAIGQLLVKRDIVPNHHLSEKKFLVGLVSEAFDYAAHRDFPPAKLACLLTIYLCTHIYFKSYYWICPAAVWQYFREIMIRHTIEDSPNGQEVFEPEECYDIMSHFHTMYMNNLPLIHLLTLGSFRLKLLWPFKAK